MPDESGDGEEGAGGDEESEEGEADHDTEGS